MKRILKRIGRWLGLIERRWWDDLDCSPVIVIKGPMLAGALERRKNPAVDPRPTGKGENE